MTKKFVYLPSGYRQRRNTLITGRAKSGEISPKGLVAHTESWDGRLQADVATPGIHMKVTPDRELRNMTMDEMLARGYFIMGEGPTGMRLKIK
jgi:hypothetical protein